MARIDRRFKIYCNGSIIDSFDTLLEAQEQMKIMKRDHVRTTKEHQVGIPQVHDVPSEEEWKLVDTGPYDVREAENPVKVNDGDINTYNSSPGAKSGALANYPTNFSAQTPDPSKLQHSEHLKVGSPEPKELVYNEVDARTDPLSQYPQHYAGSPSKETSPLLATPMRGAGGGDNNRLAAVSPHASTASTVNPASNADPRIDHYMDPNVDAPREDQRFDRPIGDNQADPNRATKMAPQGKGMIEDDNDDDVDEDEKETKDLHPEEEEARKRQRSEILTQRAGARTEGKHGRREFPLPWRKNKDK